MSPVSVDSKTGLISLDIRRPAWLLARTRKFFDRTALVVIKSVQVRDAYPPFQDVLAFIERYQFDLTWRGTFWDGHLMMHEGELSIYLTPADDDSEPVEIDPALVDELREEGLRIMNELKAN